MQPGEGKYTLFRVRAPTSSPPPPPLHPLPTLLHLSSLSPASPRRHSAETTLLKYELMKLQLTSLLRAVKLAHPGYQLNYIASSSGRSFVLPSSTDIKLFRRGWTLQKGERVVSPTFRRQKGKSAREREREKARTRNAWSTKSTSTHGREEARPCRSCCRPSCLKASTRTGKGDAVLKVLRVASARREIYGRYRERKTRIACRLTGWILKRRFSRMPMKIKRRMVVRG